MTEPVRHRYRINFEDRPAVPLPESRLQLRRAVRDDRDALAELMLDAYLGTIDYEGEGIDEALAEVDSYLADEPMLDSSWVAGEGATLASAILVSPYDENQPIVGYVMTRAAAKGQGLAGILLERSISDLSRQGWSRLDAFITDGNVPSERLFLRAGATRVG